jgi:hypothetical protein
MGASSGTLLPASSQPNPVESPSPQGRGHSPGKPLSAAELAARRANLAKARGADKDLIYRPTRRRRAASRANIQKAIAWRRSPEGNAVARLNAFKHGLAARRLPELRARLGEAPEDFAQHHQQVRQVFRPENPEERRLVERLARATWRRIRLFRAQARYEATAWHGMSRRSGRSRPTLADFSDRAFEVSTVLSEARLVENEAWRMADRVERILEALLRERAKGERVRD